MDGDGIKDISIILKWCGKEYNISELTNQDTVSILKHEIYKQTQVRPERQKLINLKYKGAKPADDLKLGLIELKQNYKLMMVGSLEEDIENVSKGKEGKDEVVDDFNEVEFDKKKGVQYSEINLAKVRKRILTYNIKELNPSRGKKLLVLDVDYTLYDHKSAAETGAELTRPYLHQFLTSAYEDYDIVLWSATGMRWIEEKMKLLGVTTNENYKIMFYLDWCAMISIYIAEKGVIEVKPLSLIWGKYQQYSAKNTIMFDDIRSNFLMNPQSGLRIRPFRQAHFTRATDKELLRLSKYLKDIAVNCPDFTTLNHRRWESYDPEPASEPELELFFNSIK